MRPLSRRSFCTSPRPAPPLTGPAACVVGPEHYGPFVMLLAAMIFHTDYHLKKATADGRRFSKFTFVGYAVSFVAIAISTLPYFGSAFAVLGLGSSFSEVELAFLENLSCAQTLLLAIIVFGVLVWYLESIPPLYLLLLALCGEYHVLVTQWFIQAYGAASWGLASLPLFIGVSALAHYFLRLDRKRSEREMRESQGQPKSMPSRDSTPRLRFVVPFQVVTWGLGAALIGLTLWTRFAAGISGPTLLGPAAWLGRDVRGLCHLLLRRQHLREEPRTHLRRHAARHPRGVLRVGAPAGPHSPSPWPSSVCRSPDWLGWVNGSP